MPAMLATEGGENVKNTLTDLNNHLFEQLERLNDESLTDEELEHELRRADGMSKIAGQIIENANLAYKVMEHMFEAGYAPKDPTAALPEMLKDHG